MIDLRNIPNGRVREWLAAPRGSRQIGGKFSENRAMRVSPEKILEYYDGLIFVENTTAARPNSRALNAGETAVAKSTRNLDFEETEALVGWDSRVSFNSGFVSGVTKDLKASGQYAGFLARTAGDWPGEFYGNLTQRVAADAFRGKRIRLRAFVRADITGEQGGGHLWLRIAQANVNLPLLLENMADRAIRAKEWQEFIIEADVPATASEIGFGLALAGIGRVMIDNVSLASVER